VGEIGPETKICQRGVVERLSAQESCWYVTPIVPHFLPLILSHLVPSQSSVFQQMLADETKACAADTTLTPITIFLNVGLNIQSKQYVKFF